MPPRPPHLHPHGPPPHELPPHLRPKKLDAALLGKSVLIATCLCVVLGAALFYFGVGSNVVLPALAPVWVGGITLLYSTHSKP